MAGETNSGIYKIDGVRIIAASAQRAEADASGLIIDQTYLKKADTSASNWNEAFDIVSSNSGNWDKVADKLDTSSFTAFTADTTAWDVTEYTAANNYIDVTNHGISGYDWNDDITAAADGASAAAVDAIENGLEYDADNKISGYAGTAFAGEKYTAGDGIAIDSNNEISVSGEYITSATAASAQDKLLVLHNNSWIEMPEAGGGYLTAGAAGADDHPDVATGASALKYIYLVKDNDAPGPDLYNEWIFTSADASTTAWEKIGDTSVDLSQYVTTSTTADDNWDVVAYSGTDGVYVASHEVGLSSDYVTAIQAVSGKLDISSYQTDSATFYTTDNPSGFITNNDISATEWNSVYETVSANSGNWQDTYTIITVPDLTAVPDVAP